VCSLAPGSLLIPGSCSVEVLETGEALEGEDCVDDDNSLLVPVADSCSGPWSPCASKSLGRGTTPDTTGKD
jgi:hypothetical protein